MQVLIVDDQESFLRLVRRIIDRMPGFQVAGEASDGNTAIKLADELKPDVILMDVNMPNMNGFQAASRILKKHPGIKIVMTSGYDKKDFENLLKEIRVTGFIHKTELNAASLQRLLSGSITQN